jgi:hypothetical protein
MNPSMDNLPRILLATAMLLVAGTEPLLAATPPLPSPQARATTVALHLLDLTAQVPAAWESQPPSSSMRLAQYRVPGKAGSGGAELVVFYFGQGQGGSAEANIARWQSQFSSATGKPVTPSVQHFKVSGMPVTTAELTGSYARTMGMAPPGAPIPDQTLLATILETLKGNLFFQLHGPTATVAANREAFLTMIHGIK